MRSEMSIPVSRVRKLTGVVRSSTPIAVPSPGLAMTDSVPPLHRNTPAGTGGNPAIRSGGVSSSGGVISAAKATSPRALMVGRPRNCLMRPISSFTVCPTRATWTRARVAKFVAMIASGDCPSVTRLRNATQPLPAAVGSPTKLGPANTPPPGATSPAAAMAILEAARAGPATARERPASRARTRERRITTGNLRATEVPVKSLESLELAIGAGGASARPSRSRTTPCPDGQTPPTSHQPARPGTPGSRHEA